MFSHIWAAIFVHQCITSSQSRCVLIWQYSKQCSNSGCHHPHSFCWGIHSVANCQADVNFLLQPLLQPAVYFRPQSLSLSLSLIDIPFITDVVLCFIYSSLAHNTVKSGAIDHHHLCLNSFVVAPPIQQHSAY